jgi:uncharacterized protein YndB with AHSA1/START domain
MQKQKPDPLTVTLPSDREILITRVVHAPRHLVFDCYTKPELVRRWLLGPPGWTMPVCDIDLRVGGRFRYVWEHADGRRMGMGGIYREIEVPHRIVHAELFDDDWTGGEALSTLVLTEEHGRTTSANTVRYTSKEARDGALKTGMTDGMEAGYARLDALTEELMSSR